MPTDIFTSPPAAAVECCGAVNAACACILPPGHKGPHICDCAGSYDDAGEIYRFPIMKGLLTQSMAVALLPPDTNEETDHA